MLFLKNSSQVIKADSFIYEISIYSKSPSSFSIQESKLVTSKEFLPEVTKSPKGSNYIYYRTLIGAPENWLINNNYIETDPENLVKKKYKKKM